MIKQPHIPTNCTIRVAIKKIIYGRNIFCPRCHSHRVVSRQQRFYCRKCTRRFSLLSHTWLSNTKLPLPFLWQIIWCFVYAVPVYQAQTITGLSEKAVRHWYDKCRNQLIKLDTRLSGTIQVDEIYFGGWKGKAIIAGKEIHTKEVRFHICKKYETYAEDVYDFFEHYITPGSTILTDSSPLYPRICRMFHCTHKRDIHAKFEFHLTSEIEGMFGNLRTFIRRIYHHVTVENLPEYLMEFHYRFSRKKYFISVYQFLLNTLRLVPTG